MTSKRPLSAICIAVSALVSAMMLPSKSHAAANTATKACKQVEPKRAKANCKLVVNFYEAFFNRREFKSADKALAESYIQHNPDTPDGRKALVDYFTAYLGQHPKAKSEIMRVSASGDLVWLHVHDTSDPTDRGKAVVDIFRVQRGKIVEHWDVIQQVPAQQSNGNTMF